MIIQYITYLIICIDYRSTYIEMHHLHMFQNPFIFYPDVYLDVTGGSERRASHRLRCRRPGRRLSRADFIDPNTAILR